MSFGVYVHPIYRWLYIAMSLVLSILTNKYTYRIDNRIQCELILAL